MGTFNLAKLRRQAVHGRGDNWTEVGHGENPRQFLPMDWAPQFGGRWNTDFPSGGTNNTNKDSDVAESTRGRGDVDFDPQGKLNRINEMLHGGPETPEVFVLIYKCKDGESPKDKAQELRRMLGKDEDADVAVDGTTIRVQLPNFDIAMSLQPRIPGSTVERKERRV